MSWTYKHVVEIGAGDGASSEGLKLADQAEMVRLYEPNPILYQDLHEKARKVPGRAFRAAIYPQTAPLVHMGYASWMVGSPAFVPLSVEPEGLAHYRALERPVLCVSCMHLPPDMDMLILTTNGSEAAILADMPHRPKVIRTKHYCHSAAHWREAHKVFEWMRQNGYRGQQLDRNQHGTFVSISWERTGS